MKVFAVDSRRTRLGLLAFRRRRAKVPPADLVFKNGNIYTVNDAQPKAEAVAVKGDRIVFVGSNRDVQKYVGANYARHRSQRQDGGAGND